VKSCPHVVEFETRQFEFEALVNGGCGAPVVAATRTLAHEAGAYFAPQLFEPDPRVEVMKLEGSTALVHH